MEILSKPQAGNLAGFGMQNASSNFYNNTLLHYAQNLH